jgi:hypothetical protein
MYNVQILLPLCDNSGEPFPADILKALQDELTKRFGGLTAYTRAPAKGVWAPGPIPKCDEIVIVEVMVEDLDKEWWQAFRRHTECILQQHELVIRAIPIEVI